MPWWPWPCMTVTMSAHLRCLDDRDHVCSQGRGNKRTFTGLPSKASKSPLVRRTYHEQVLDGHHVCSTACTGLFCAGWRRGIIITIMSAEYSLRTDVKVSFVRDENKKEACFFSAFVVAVVFSDSIWIQWMFHLRLEIHNQLPEACLMMIMMSFICSCRNKK